MAFLPTFNKEGLLNPGDYELTLEQLLLSSLVLGPADAVSWNVTWRRKLVQNLEVLVNHLVTVGLTKVFLDGSFVERKDLPNDIDGYFVCDAARWASGEPARRLQELDPIWTWDPGDREPFRGYPKPQLPMWHKYRIELFPHYGQFCGLFDQNGCGLTFADAFRQSRAFTSKGIVKIGGLS